jgi:hypothetical protein
MGELTAMLPHNLQQNSTLRPHTYRFISLHFLPIGCHEATLPSQHESPIFQSIIDGIANPQCGYNGVPVGGNDWPHLAHNMSKRVLPNVLLPSTFYRRKA